jgi:hypothetical protein
MADRYAYLPLYRLVCRGCVGSKCLDFNCLDFQMRGPLPARWHSESRIPSLWRAAPALLVVVSLGMLSRIASWATGATMKPCGAIRVERHRGELRGARAILRIALAKQGHDPMRRSFISTGSLGTAQVSGRTRFLRARHCTSCASAVPRQAMEECDAALARLPPIRRFRPLAWSGLGQAHLELRHYDQAATRATRRLVRLNPEDGPALTGSGLFWRCGRGSPTQR